MRYGLALFVGLIVLVIATSTWAADGGSTGSDAAVASIDGGAVSAPSEPTSVDEAIASGKAAIAAAKAGQWWYFAGLVAMVIMFVLKRFTLLDKLGRWKYVILPVLALTAALLSAFQSGASVETAITVFTSTWATGMLEELWSHGIRGQPHQTVATP